jgi:NAD(P)-dependent dehydrogenase (short-subunit alcohol dehydrogenase family)
MYTSWIPGLIPAGQITNAVLFLASDEAGWITGHALAVDGGGTQY